MCELVSFTSCAMRSRRGDKKFLNLCGIYIFRTPLHADVFSSFSWSVNICGKKKWIFLPPGEEDKLRDKFGNLVFDLTSQELSDASMYPNYSSQVEKIVLIQEIGDAVFVPSGWHHQVWNLVCFSFFFNSYLSFIRCCI